MYITYPDTKNCFRVKGYGIVIEAIRYNFIFVMTLLPYADTGVRHIFLKGTFIMKIHKESKVSPAIKLLFMLLPLILAIASLCIGRIGISPLDVLRSAFANVFGGELLEPIHELTLWKLRLPRILLALLAGAGLSVSGCAFQGLFSNPLATPDTLGVASGASFGAALALLFGFELIGIQLMSFIFGIAAVVLTVISGNTTRSKGMHGVVLAGIMIGSLFSALISLVKYVADTENELPAITYWLMGSLDSASYKTLLFGAPITIAGILILFLIRWRMNLLPLSEEEAISAGVNIKLLRMVVILCATMITASCVSMCGQVGWVGLLVPHMCRMKFGSNYKTLIPYSVLIGSAFLVAVDTAARSMSAAPLPISILTAIIGAPFFIVLMRKSGGFFG